MRIGKKINEEINFVESVQTLVKAYEEISVVKMQRARSTVLSAREFLDLLHEVFSDVKMSYSKEIARIEGKKKTKKNGQKRVGIFLSANSRLYGDIIKRIFSLYLKDYGNTYDEMIIIGKVGKELMEASRKNINFRFIDYDDKNISKDLILSIMNEVKEFDKAQVYYGKFENVVTQEPVVMEILGDEIVVNEESKKVNFFFEPALAQVLAYFESQIISAFLLQSIHESDLAKLASRTKTMEQARQRIEDKQRALILSSHRARRIIDDKKQQERLSGMFLWKK